MLEYNVNEYTAPILEVAETQNPRFILLYGGERSGKSIGTVAIAGLKVPPNKYAKQRLYWIVGPDFLQCRAEFGYLYGIYSKLNLVTKVSMPESGTVRWYMELATGERWETRSSADVTKLATFSIHGAMIVEANQQPLEVWHKIRGRLAENRGWCIISGTYENVAEWFVDTYEKWSVKNKDGGRSFSLPMWANAKAFPGGFDDPEIQLLKSTLPHDWFMERYAGIPSKPSGLVLPEFEYGIHVGAFERDPELPVELAVDPGKRRYCVAFVQKHGDVIVVLDCIYKSGWIAQKVIPEVMRHPLWPYVPKIGLCGAMDIAGFAEPATISQAELWREMAGVEFYAKKYPEIETINTVREGLALNQLLFNNLGNESMNGEAIEPLAEFRLWKWRDEVESMSERASPIDRNNHFTKALGYYRIWKYGQTTIKKPRKPKKPQAKGTGWRSVTRDRTSTTDSRRLRTVQAALQATGSALGSSVQAGILERRTAKGGTGFRSARAGNDKHAKKHH